MQPEIEMLNPTSNSHHLQQERMAIFNEVQHIIIIFQYQRKHIYIVF